MGDPPVSDVTFFGPKEVSWIPLSVTSLFWSKKRHVTDRGDQLTSFGPKNVTSLTGGSTDLLWSKKRHVTDRGDQLTSYLHEILSDRESISGSMQTVLDDATTAWGIKVERVEIKDARLPVQLQRAMAAEAEAAREARAKVIAAEGEQKASRALKEASEVISESSSALQLRYLQTLNSIAAEHNSTIIFPMPMNILDHFMGKKSKDKDLEALEDTF